MEDQGWIATVVIGGLAGWLAEKAMRSDMGTLSNILLGVAGAFLLDLLLGLVVDVDGAGRWAFLLVAFAGACLLIALIRALRRWRP